MLAQSFQSAADLGITELQKEALRKTLVLLETGKLRLVPMGGTPEYADQPSVFSGQFNMNQWRAENECGTICCIGGTAELIGGVDMRPRSHNGRLIGLFYPDIDCLVWASITPAQAARALRSFLTTGDAKWQETVSA